MSFGGGISLWVSDGACFFFCAPCLFFLWRRTCCHVFPLLPHLPSFVSPLLEVREKNAIKDLASDASLFSASASKKKCFFSISCFLFAKAWLASPQRLSSFKLSKFVSYGQLDSSLLAHRIGAVWCVFPATLLLDAIGVEAHPAVSTPNLSWLVRDDKADYNDCRDQVILYLPSKWTGES